MNGHIKTALAACAALLLAASTRAAPMLQLGVWDPVAGVYAGYYDDVTETTIFTGSSAVIRALLTLGGNPGPNPPELDYDYMISAAILPPTGSPFGNFGAFTFDGTTITPASTLTYGVPPADPTYPDIATHSIFDAWFAEFTFNFSGATTNTFNVETGDYEAGQSYYADFSLDSAGLDPDYLLHFDLYEVHLKPNGRWALDFAPYSHDAEGGPPVPEPGTLVLLASGLGLVAVSTIARRRTAG